MPLTAYSLSLGKELDVEQLLSYLNRDDEVSDLADLHAISADKKQIISRDIECPICFVKGAELVSGGRSKKTGELIRQPCFRFSNPGHGKFCDYSNTENIKTPENLIDFGKPGNNITRLIRRLVCSAIELKIVDQTKIRDMRQWFYGTKETSSFIITINPDTPIKLYQWVQELRAGHSARTLPANIQLNKAIASTKGFDWKLETRRQLYSIYTKLSEQIDDSKLWQLHDQAVRVKSIIEKNLNIEVYDPTVLQKEYELTIDLARFINHHEQIATHSYHYTETKYSPLVAFSALLLYVNNWNLTSALEDFAKISQHTKPDLMLGNVMGLNPFHDYQAWRLVKELQNLPAEVQNIENVSVALSRIETNIRASFG